MSDQTRTWFSSQTNANASHGAGMRPDEQYPIPVYSNPDETLPEVTPPSQPEYYAPNQGKEVVPAYPGTPGDSNYSYSPMTGVTEVSPQHDGKEVAYTAGAGTGADAGPGGDAAAQLPSRICGMPKRTFWVVLAIAGLVVIGAVVGGVVGGLMSSSSSSASSSASATATATSSGSSASATSTAVSLAATDRPLAVSNTAGTGSTAATMQIFYQSLNSTDILYRLNWAGDRLGEQTASLSVTPLSGTPLAVNAYNSTGNNVAVNLFYLATNSSSNTSIAHAVLTCAQYSSTCSTDKNEIISTNFTRPIESSGGLAAVALNSSSQRVWVQATGSVIWELSNDDSSVNTWTQANLGVSAVLGTDLAALEGPNSTELMVVFARNSDGLPTALEYGDAEASSNGNEAALASSPTGWSNTTFLTACYDPGLDDYHIFYKGSGGFIRAYWRISESGSWTANQDSDWGSPQGGLAATCWYKEVRLLFFTNDQLAMNIQSNNTWSKWEYY